MQGLTNHLIVRPDADELVVKLPTGIWLPQPKDPNKAAQTVATVVSVPRRIKSLDPTDRMHRYDLIVKEGDKIIMLPAVTSRSLKNQQHELEDELLWLSYDMVVAVLRPEGITTVGEFLLVEPIWEKEEEITKVIKQNNGNEVGLLVKPNVEKKAQIGIAVALGNPEKMCGQ